MNLNTTKLFVTTLACFTLLSTQDTMAANWNVAKCQLQCSANNCGSNPELAKQCIANCDPKYIKNCETTHNLFETGRLYYESELEDENIVYKDRLRERNDLLKRWENWCENDESCSSQLKILNSEPAHLKEKYQSLIQETEINVEQESSTTKVMDKGVKRNVPDKALKILGIN